MEEYNFKRYVYVSTKVRADLEEVLKKKNVIQTMRFINNYDITNFFRTELKNLKGVTYLFLDLASFEGSKDNDIITTIKLIRQKYECRIIIIAQGYKQGDFILGRIFNLGIYNIITANNDVEFISQLEKTITDEGMSFGNSMKYQIDENIINIGSNKTIIKENFIKVKQTVTIGIASTEKHSGATTLAINLAKYLNEFDNITACYIENNNHNTIKSFTRVPEAIYYDNKKMVHYDGLDLYFKPENIAEIQKYDYSFYINDFGNFDEMSDEAKDNFISRDLKFIVSGSRIWEEEKIADCLFTLGNDEVAYLFINFLEKENRETFKKMLGTEWSNKTYFSDLILNPFKVQNRDIYRIILEPYLLNQNIKEEKKKGFFSIFKKNKK